MKINIRNLSVAIVGAALLATTVFAFQAAVRVRFAKGKSSAVLSGTVGRYGKRDYILGARKGQQLSANVESSCESVTLDVIDNGTGQSLTDPVTEYSDELPGSGDYVVRVQNSDTASCRYSVTVGIE